MKVIVGCEKSKRVAAAFRARGHNAWSCDILPAEGSQDYHIQGDILNHLNDGWDMGIFHPDCTRISNSGVQWLFKIPGRYEQMIRDCDFFNKLLNSKIPRICVENPIQHKYAREFIRIYDQIIQPWQFGDLESKATCLWLVGLPPLLPLYPYKPLNVKQSVWREPPSPERKANRARTFQGIAEAMAEQWGGSLI